jgi:hypothetical protein
VKIIGIVISTTFNLTSKPQKRANFTELIELETALNPMGSHS